MQLLPIVLVAAVLIADSGVSPIGAQWHLSHGQVTLLAIAPVLMAILATYWGTRWCLRRLRRGVTPGPFIAAERIMRWCRWIIVVNHLVVVLAFGWLQVVRLWTDDLILLDELVALLPALLGIMGTWWAHYPIERELRAAVLIRRLDDGQPIYQMPPRLNYVILQVRMHLLLLLAPLLVILALAEAVEVIAALRMDRDVARQWRETGTFFAAAAVFIFSPLLARLLLTVRPLPQGSLRESLLAICAKHRVKIRELLLWDTNGTMINAAVMGLAGPLRYVLITDALLESMYLPQIQAVMAHEIGHVRRHHMTWLIVSLFASLGAAWVLLTAPAHAAAHLGWRPAPQLADAISMAFTVAHLAIGLLVFGWICRRFERQADTFAVQHLSDASGSTVVMPEAVEAMRSALHTIARLNTIDLRRPSWRHGSIVWRQRYLQSIIGRPLQALPIDRLVRWIKVAALLTLAATIGLQLWLEAQPLPDSTARRGAAPPPDGAAMIDAQP